MPPIVLVAINARYIHPPFGLYCLRAALGPLRDQSSVLEFTLKTEVEEMAQTIAAQQPRIVGLSVYLWNRARVEALAPRLRQLCPGVILVAGGPEPMEGMDGVVEGEGEEPFRALCEVMIGMPDVPGVWSVTHSPYDEYSDEDLRTRLTYVETTRGCAFTCSFCTSAIHPMVKAFPIQSILADLERLLARGAHKLKFLDRSFNLNPARATIFLDFFLARLSEYPFFVHFEMVPDRFPPKLMDRLSRFPAGRLQLEIGVQTLNPAVSQAIQRPLDPSLVIANLEALTRDTQATLHVDLIAGLPGETLEGFGRGFDRLWAVLSRRPGNEIQLGILKRLPGTPLDQTPEPGAVFRTEAPYDLIESPHLTARELHVLNHMARLWERLVNRGHFPETTILLGEAPFTQFYAFTEWFLTRHEVSWGLARHELGQELAIFLSGELK